MIGVVGGLAAALLWGTSGVAAARSSRILGAEAALAWVYITGLVVVLPFAAASGFPDPDGRGLAWTAVAAPSAVVSLYLTYAALRRGPVSLVMPITAAQGGVAALIAVALGERLEMLAAVGLGIVLLGTYAAMRRPTGPIDAHYPAAALVLAALSAAVSGLALYAGARSGAALGTPWLLLVLRTVGVLALALPLAARGSLPRPRAAMPFVVFSGLADTAAFASYVYAANHGGVAVPAVLSSQFAAVSALLAVFAMGERLTRVQVAGTVSILLGAALVTAVQS